MGRRGGPYAWIENAVGAEGVEELMGEVRRWATSAEKVPEGDSLDAKDPLAIRTIALAGEAIRRGARELARKAGEETRMLYEQGPLVIEPLLCVFHSPAEPTDGLPYVPHRDDDDGWGAILYLGKWTGGELRIGSEAEDRRFDQIPGAGDRGYTSREYLPRRHRLEVNEGSVIVFDPKRVHCIDPVKAGIRISIHFGVGPEEAWN